MIEPVSGHQPGHLVDAAAGANGTTRVTGRAG
jgi:hypothetical protein